MKRYYIYVMGNKKQNKFYPDFTENLVVSLQENGTPNINQASGFNLVYFEQVENIFDAVTFKMEFEKRNVKWKTCLIEKFNPGWKDLFIEYLFKTGQTEN